MYYTFLYLFLLFMIYAVIGWIIEMLIHIFTKRKLPNKGFLIGPYCPAYGFGAMVMLFVIYQAFNNPFLFFFLFLIYSIMLEYFTAYLMEQVFYARVLDRSKTVLNIRGRVCLVKAFALGLLGFLCAYILNPSLMQVIFMIPNSIFYLIVGITAVIFIIDLAITFRATTNIRKNISKLDKAELEDYNHRLNEILENKKLAKASPEICEEIEKIHKKKKHS